jgi:hypothetical protein
VQVKINVIKLGKLYMGVTQLGGVTLRGRTAAEPGDAVRNLFWKLAGQDRDDDDAKVAVELAVAGTDLNAQLAIGDGSE